MGMRVLSLLTTGFMALAFALPLGAQEVAERYGVPHLKEITIDGEHVDWGNDGLHISILLPVSGKPYSLSDVEASARLGWDERGLLVLVQASDDASVESNDANALANGDSVELFVATERGSRDRYQVVIAPGVAGDQSASRTQQMDLRQMEPRGDLQIESAHTQTASGYIIEALLPWANLNITPEMDVEFAFQLYVNDADGPDDRHQLVWYPETNAQNNTNAMYTLRLAKKASPPVVARVTGDYDEGLRTHVHVVATGDYADETVIIRDGRTKTAKEMFRAENGFAVADLLFDMPERDLGPRTFEIRSSGDELGTLALPDADVIRAQRLMFMPMVLTPSIMHRDTFSEPALVQPLLAEKLLGTATIKTTYYDKNYNVVDRASNPGRYGAVVEIAPEFGPTVTRTFTLFRAPEGYNPTFQWWFQRKGARLDLPPTLQIDPSIQDAQADAIGKFVGNLVEESVAEDSKSAVLLAGLYESEPGMAPATVANDAWAMDRQWWVGLKRKLTGMDQFYPNAFVCPYQKEGEPAPTLRPGTPEEAGMNPEVIGQLDALLNEWVEASGEPFAVCLTRHGVVYYHKAFGTRDGQPITVDTKSWMASISKFLSGTLMMTLVDQGFVDLDAPVDTYLPQFRGIEVETPLTIRHLYNHTNGFQLNLRPPRDFVDHWGDDHNDLEYVLAEYYPYLEVGTRHGYNGVGFALGGKVMETITGEALPQLFRNHLWGPLGCNGTDAVDGSARTFSTPMDMAIFGQMMLNKGSYGNMRFFSEESYEKLLPVNLAPYVKFDTSIEWGVGGVWMRGGGLSDQTFGHGAASAATLRIDPVSDLVVVMTRNSAGSQFGEYHERFLQTVSGAIAK